VSGVHRVDKNDYSKKVDCQWTRGSRSRISSLLRETHAICMSPRYYRSLHGVLRYFRGHSSDHLMLMRPLRFRTKVSNRVDRLASWWWSYTRETDPRNMFPWQGSAFSESPPTTRPLQGQMISILKCIHSTAGRKCRHSYSLVCFYKVFVQAYLRQTRPKASFYLRSELERPNSPRSAGT
jgi:hypothetical protein